MGFKDWFVEDKTGNSSLKVQCTGCSRITVVKIPSGKSFEKWNKDTKCGQCNGINCWNKLLE
jgi:hypothetical protein